MYVYIQYCIFKHFNILRKSGDFRPILTSTCVLIQIRLVL